MKPFLAKVSIFEPFLPFLKSIKCFTKTKITNFGLPKNQQNDISLF